jgi:hypothetical protein
MAVPIAALVPSVVHAGSSRLYRSASLGVAFNYPATWYVSPASDGPLKGVTVYSTTSPDSLVLSVLPVKPAKSIGGTLKRYLSYTTQINGPAAAHYHWTSATFAGRKAEGTIIHPSTEGGVKTAVGIYVLGAGKHIYAVTMQTRGVKPPATLAAFPTAYRQIITSWRFV